MSYDQEIHVLPPSTRTGSWCASRQVPRGWAEMRMVGMRVLGGSEGNPAFVEATGRTADEAVTELYKRLGECFLAAEAWQNSEIQVGTPPHEITCLFEMTLEEAKAIIAQAMGADEAPEVWRLAPLDRLVEFVKMADRKRQGLE